MGVSPEGEGMEFSSVIVDAAKRALTPARTLRSRSDLQNTLNLFIGGN